MNYRPLRSAALAASLVLALGACGDHEATQVGAAAQPAADMPTAAPSAARGDSPSAAANAAPAASTASLWRGGEVAPLDVQVAHPNGVVLQLTSLQSRPMETAVGVRVVNGRKREVHLNRFNSRRAYIVMDTGERIYISPPAGNTDLTIPAGQSMEGELVFLGRLPRAESATLVLNENSSADNRATDTPRFQLDLPVAGGFGTAQ